MDRIDLERYLEENDVEAELTFTGTSVHTAEAAAEEMDADVSEVVKSLVFMVDSEPVLAILPGDEEVSEGKLKEIFDAEECRIAEPEEVERATGYRVGEVPPVGVDIPTIIDESVMEEDEVYAGGGSDRYLLKISPEEIKQNTDSRVEKVHET